MKKIIAVFLTFCFVVNAMCFSVVFAANNVMTSGEVITEFTTTEIDEKLRLFMFAEP